MSNDNAKETHNLYSPVSFCGGGGSGGGAGGGGFNQDLGGGTPTLVDGNPR